MYSIYADDLCIYDDRLPDKTVKLSEPKLTLEDNSAGSLTFTMPPTNIGYDVIERLTTDIRVLKNGIEIWAGRVISEKKDFWNNRQITCEGELAFFNDTIQPQAKYNDITPDGFLRSLIAVHNSKVAENRQFTVGVVSVEDANNRIYRYTNFETTWECLNEKLVKRMGGHFIVRKENGVRYLDYRRDDDGQFPNVNNQVIRFGQNLLDFTRSWTMADYATAILPLGAHLDSKPLDDEGHEISALDAYITIASVNDGNLYVHNETAVSNFGWIAKVVRWDDVTVPENLKKKANAYLSDLQFDEMTIELTAVDLRYLSADYESFNFLDKVRVLSSPHGMDRYFLVSKLEIPLDKPENTQFKLGNKIRTSMTGSSNSANEEILERIESIPKASTLLDLAKLNATEIMNSGISEVTGLIDDVSDALDDAVDDMGGRVNSMANALNKATHGYITIVTDQNGSKSLIISNNQDLSLATKLWKWGMNGLAYSNDGGQTYGLAMTIDGSIVADRITTGTMNIAQGLVIQTEADASDHRLFMVDHTGARLYNSRIALGNNKIDILLDPTIGIAIGETGMYTIGPLDDVPTLDTTKTTFWIDTDGVLHLTGILEAAGGSFEGDISAATGTFSGSISIGGRAPGTLDPDDPGEPAPFRVDDNGNVFMSGATISTDISTQSVFTGIVQATSGYFNGELRAANGTFSGDLVAASGSFTGELSIGGHTADPDDPDDHDVPPKFVVTQGGDVTSSGNFQTAGNVTLGGNVTLAGNIIWSTGADPNKTLYARSKLGTPSNRYDTYAEESESNWHRTYDGINDCYASYSHDGGLSWTAPVQLKASGTYVLYARKKLPLPTNPYAHYANDDANSWHRLWNTEHDAYKTYGTVDYSGGEETWTWSDPTNVVDLEGQQFELYARKKLSTPIYPYVHYNVHSYNNDEWHIARDPDDYYVSYGTVSYEDDEDDEGTWTWSAPIRIQSFLTLYIYCRNSTAQRPASQADYADLPDTDPTGWHKVYDTDDLYRSESVDGGETWGDPERVGAFKNYVLYRRAYTNTPPSGSYESFPNTNANDWHKTLDRTNDYYASYSYDGGQTWSVVVRFQGKDGTEITRADIIAQLATSATAGDGIYSYTDPTDGKKYIGVSATYIKSGYIDANTVQFKTGSETGVAWLHLYKGSIGGNEGSNATDGLAIERDSGGRCAVTDKGAHIQYGNNQVYVTSGGIGLKGSPVTIINATSCVTPVGWTVNSDRRLKENISYNLDSYDRFFDSLKPSTFSLINDKSKKLHSGFIAQEVEDALIQNGLTRDDFAGLSIIEGYNEQYDMDDVYGLGYTEFISLNTYMIQKLKARIEELERRLDSL